MPERIRLRPIHARDLPLLLQIYGSTREIELARVAWTVEERAAFLASQFDLQHRDYQMRFPRGEFHVVQYLEQDIGRLYLDRHGPELRLIDIALLPAWRNRGIGSSILRCLTQECDGGGQAIVLHVEATNPARALYERCGFEVVADDGLYLQLRRRPCPMAA